MNELERLVYIRLLGSLGLEKEVTISNGEIQCTLTPINPEEQVEEGKAVKAEGRKDNIHHNYIYYDGLIPNLDKITVEKNDPSNDAKIKTINVPLSCINLSNLESAGYYDNKKQIDAEAISMSIRLIYEEDENHRVTNNGEQLQFHVDHKNGLDGQNHCLDFILDNLLKSRITDSSDREINYVSSLGKLAPLIWTRLKQDAIKKISNTENYDPTLVELKDLPPGKEHKIFKLDTAIMKDYADKCLRELGILTLPLIKYLQLNVENRCFTAVGYDELNKASNNSSLVHAITSSAVDLTNHKKPDPIYLAVTTGNHAAAVTLDFTKNTIFFANPGGDLSNFEEIIQKLKEISQIGSIQRPLTKTLLREKEIPFSNTCGVDALVLLRWMIDAQDLSDRCFDDQVFDNYTLCLHALSKKSTDTDQLGHQNNANNTFLNNKQPTTLIQEPKQTQKSRLYPSLDTYKTFLNDKQPTTPIRVKSEHQEPTKQLYLSQAFEKNQIDPYLAQLKSEIERFIEKIDYQHLMGLDRFCDSLANLAQASKTLYAQKDILPDQTLLFCSQGCPKKLSKNTIYFYQQNKKKDGYQCIYRLNGKTYKEDIFSEDNRIINYLKNAQQNKEPSSLIHYEDQLIKLTSHEDQLIKLTSYEKYSAENVDTILIGIARECIKLVDKALPDISDNNQPQIKALKKEIGQLLKLEKATKDHDQETLFYVKQKLPNFWGKLIRLIKKVFHLKDQSTLDFNLVKKSLKQAQHQWNHTVFRPKPPTYQKIKDLTQYKQVLYDCVKERQHDKLKWALEEHIHYTNQELDQDRNELFIKALFNFDVLSVKLLLEKGYANAQSKVLTHKIKTSPLEHFFLHCNNILGQGDFDHVKKDDARLIIQHLIDYQGVTNSVTIQAYLKQLDLDDINLDQELSLTNRSQQDADHHTQPQKTSTISLFSRERDQSNNASVSHQTHSVLRTF